MKTKRYFTRIMKVFALLAATVAALWILCSCTADRAAEERSDGHVILNCSFDVLVTGESRRYYAKQSPAAADYTLLWESSDENVATVDDDGTVTAVAGGKTYITVRAEGKPYRADMELTVADATVGGADGKDGLQSAVDKVKNDGVVLITDGYFGSIEVDKRLTLAGTGKAAVAGIKVADDARLFLDSVTVYATPGSGADACVTIGKNASLTAVGCTFFYDDPTGQSVSDVALSAPSDADGIYCRACSFNGYSECLGIGPTDGEIYVVNNDFSGAETAVRIDLRKSDGESDGRATGKVADNVYISCKECVKLLFNALAYTGTLEIPDADVSVPG